MVDALDEPIVGPSEGFYDDCLWANGLSQSVILWLPFEITRFCSIGVFRLIWQFTRFRRAHPIELNRSNVGRTINFAHTGEGMNDCL